MTLHVPRRKLIAIAATAGILLCSGCASVESIRRDVLADRTRAYDEWLKARKSDEESETVIKGELSLQDAIQLALVNNKSLQTVVKEKEIARGRIVESYSEALPKLYALGSYTRPDEVRSLDVGGQTVSLEDNYSADLKVRQPLYRGGAIGAAIRTGRIYSCLSDETVRDAVQDTIYRVAGAYFETLLAQHLCDANEEALKSAESHLADVKHKLAHGVASRFDVLRAEVDASNFKAEMIQQRNRMQMSRTRLLKSVGASQESEVVLSDKLTYEPVRPVLEEAVRLGYENRPDLHRAELALRLQGQALRVARSRYWPKLDLMFNQSWARPDPHDSTRDEWGDGWMAGVTVEWPLFDGMGREGRLIQERTALKQKRIQLLDAEELALLEIRQAILSLQSAEEFVESQRLNLDRAKEALRLVEVGYREGVNTQVEVTDARAAFTRTAGLYYQAVYNHTIARLTFQKALGILGPLFPESHNQGGEKE